MPRFTAVPAMTPYPDGRTWYLDGPLVYGDIQVPAFFETDFASCPQIVTNLLPHWDTYGPAAIVHDWLYWSQPCPRKCADDTFYEAMAVLGVVYWKRQTLYNAVRVFGAYAWDTNANIAQQGYSRVRTPQSPPIPEWNRD